MRVTSQENFKTYGDIKEELEYQNNLLHFCRINVSFRYLYPQIKIVDNALKNIKNKSSIKRDNFDKLRVDINKYLNEFDKNILNVPTFNFRYSENYEENRAKIIKKKKKFLKKLNMINVDNNIGLHNDIYILEQYFNRHIISDLKNDYVHFAFNIKKYLYNFSSSKKEECNLLRYHDISEGKNCQFIGFFGPNMNLVEFTNFVFRQENPLFVFYRTENDKINIIDNSLKYNHIYSKHEKEKFYQLLHAEEHVKIVDVDSRDESSQYDGGIRSRPPLSDEYVLISNDDLVIYTIEIKKCEYLVYEHSKATIMYNYLKKINRLPYDYIVTIDILQEKENDSRKFIEKYIKYKTKYLELKFKQTNFYNDK